MALQTDWWITREKGTGNMLCAWPFKLMAERWVEEFCAGMEIEIIPVEVEVRLRRELLV